MCISNTVFGTLSLPCSLPLPLWGTNVKFGLEALVRFSLLKYPLQRVKLITESAGCSASLVLVRLQENGSLGVVFFFFPHQFVSGIT